MAIEIMDVESLRLLDSCSLLYMQAAVTQGILARSEHAGLAYVPGYSQHEMTSQGANWLGADGSICTNDH